MKVCTIGFTKTTAEKFFERLQRSAVDRVVDVRLNNRSQLAGFAKRDDLKYFLRSIGGIDYIHEPLLAPTQDILDAFKKHKGSWEEYEVAFLSLMRDREIERALSRDLFDGSCLLCSEHTAHHCHRRLVVEYLVGAWPDCSIEVKHL